MRRYLIGAIALLALTVTSLGLAVGSPTAVPDAASNTTSLGTAAAVRCSKAEATAVVNGLQLGNAGLVPNPVSGVLCGAFLGPGSNAMVVSLLRETCFPNLGWAVLRGTGDAWQLVMRRDGVANRVGCRVRHPGRSACLPERRPALHSERRHEGAHLALERLAPRGRSVEAGDAWYSDTAFERATERLLQDAVRQHRLRLRLRR
jgi:hypothetical protein